jgi:uncharacterized protein (DUF488 family)
MTETSNLFTIGFTQKSAENFFGLLSKNAIRTLIDTRLNNTGQLAGFSKRDDLKYFCKTILSTEYVHWLESAPEEAMLSAYKKKEISWSDYANEYLSLIEKRKVESSMSLVSSGGACLLCSEAKPHQCHRSLLADYLSKKSGHAFKVQHLT